MIKKLSPSMMCADFFHLADQLTEFEENGIEYLHIDVMDGSFVPNYTLGTDFAKRLKAHSPIPLDIHLMTENPELKFSVEGHTDNTGNPTGNQTLSEARAKAIVDKLVELGIAPDRLSAVGKGQTSPIADNTTDEGRAKNRRVEFVKQ